MLSLFCKIKRKSLCVFFLLCCFVHKGQSCEIEIVDDQFPKLLTLNSQVLGIICQFLHTKDFQSFSKTNHYLREQSGIYSNNTHLLLKIFGQDLGYRLRKSLIKAHPCFYQSSLREMSSLTSHPYFPKNIVPDLIQSFQDPEKLFRIIRFLSTAGIPTTFCMIKPWLPMNAKTGNLYQDTFTIVNKRLERRSLDIFFERGSEALEWFVRIIETQNQRILYDGEIFLDHNGYPQKGTHGSISIEVDRQSPQTIDLFFRDLSGLQSLRVQGLYFWPDIRVNGFNSQRFLCEPLKQKKRNKDFYTKHFLYAPEGYRWATTDCRNPYTSLYLIADCLFKVNQQGYLQSGDYYPLGMRFSYQAERRAGNLFEYFEPLSIYPFLQFDFKPTKTIRITGGLNIKMITDTVYSLSDHYIDPQGIIRNIIFDFRKTKHFLEWQLSIMDQAFMKAEKRGFIKKNRSVYSLLIQFDSTGHIDYFNRDPDQKTQPLLTVNWQKKYLPNSFIDIQFKDFGGEELRVSNVSEIFINKDGQARPFLEELYMIPSLGRRFLCWTFGDYCGSVEPSKTLPNRVNS